MNFVVAATLSLRCSAPFWVSAVTARRKARAEQASSPPTLPVVAAWVVKRNQGLPKKKLQEVARMLNHRRQSKSMVRGSQGERDQY